MSRKTRGTPAIHREDEAEETLRAIRQGEVDALVVTEPHGERVYTLKSADRLYRMMMESMRQGAVTLTAEGVMLYCNACFAEMVETPLQDLLGAEVHPFVHAASRGVFTSLFDTRGQGEVLLQTGGGAGGAGGAGIPAYLSFSELPPDEPGEPLLCMVVTDLTEQKRSERIVAEEQLARHAAEARNQAKDHFLATLSHELRTPLTPVLALISSLEEGGQLPAALQDVIGMMRRNIELEARLIDDLLDLTRVASGKIELDRRELDLRDVIAHAVQISCGEELAAGRHEIRIDLAEGDHRLWGDSPRLMQVFCNLLNNAVKFTPEGGEIALTSFRDADRMIIEISDTGIGIEPRVMPRIFDAFEQGEAWVTRRFGGLGLGLAISKAIVELHGGTIGVRSDGKDQGATFTVRLPAETAEPRASDAARPGPREPVAAPAHVAPLRILLVEDHADSAGALAELLGIRGHQVQIASTIAQALAQAEAAGFDLVISDLGLPDGNGRELMRQLSRSHGLRGIALSGYGMKEDLRRSMEAGFERHLTKPVNLQDLEEAIRQVAAGLELASG